MNTRCSPTKLQKFLAKLKGTPKEKVVMEIGMGSLMKIKNRQMKLDFMKHLINIFDVRKQAMIFRDYLIPLTVDDVQDILGLKNEGEDVLGYFEGTDEAGLMKQYGIDRATSCTALEEKILSVDADCAELKGLLMLYIMGTFLCPSTSNTVDPKYLKCFCKEGFTGKFNWAEHVHDVLLEGILDYQRKEVGGKNPYVRGCIVLLEVKSKFFIKKPVKLKPLLS